jgi:hypothetical protein
MKEVAGAAIVLFYGAAVLCSVGFPIFLVWAIYRLVMHFAP